MPENCQRCLSRKVNNEFSAGVRAGGREGRRNCEDGLDCPHGISDDDLKGRSRMVIRGLGVFHTLLCWINNLTNTRLGGAEIEDAKR
jgi:hypothetical protein